MDPSAPALRFACVNARSMSNKASEMNDHILYHDLDQLVIIKMWFTSAEVSHVKTELLPDTTSCVTRCKRASMAEAWLWCTVLTPK